LHVSKIQQNFISVNKFINDNYCFFELHSNYFSMNDQKTQTTLLQGPPEDGLYRLLRIGMQNSHRGPRAFVAEQEIMED
jgi:hypothetical protein